MLTRSRRAFFALTLLLALTPGCFSTTAGPCADYCDYICECHPNDGDTTCDDCRIVYTDEDPALQDECETALADMEAADREAGEECVGDTGA